MVRPLPAGCRLTAIFDSCVRFAAHHSAHSRLIPSQHSATALDLPYVYSTEGKIKEPNLLAEAGSGAMSAATSYLRGDMSGVFGALGGLAKKAMSGNKGQEISRRTRTSAADVISFSGCKDDQTSADTCVVHVFFSGSDGCHRTEAGKATGAMVSNIACSPLH
jgi:hypothetical protein